MRNLVYFHHRDEACVVDAPTDHLMSLDEPFPFEKYIGSISQQREYSLERDDVSGSFVNRKGKTIVSCGRVATAQNSIRFWATIESCWSWRVKAAVARLASACIGSVC